MIVLEILVILLIIGLQLRVYWQNRQQAAALALLFPQKDQLRLEPEQQARASLARSPQELLLGGAPFVLAQEPDKQQQLRGRDGEFWIVEESPRAGGAPTTYLLSQQEVEQLPQKPGFQLLQEQQASPTAKPLMLPAAQDPSPAFGELLTEIWAFLQGSRGTVAGLEGLRDMSQRKLETEATALQSSVATPLYIGLLGTFLGVILGLGAIVTDGITDDAIERFLLGVVVAMGGSFFGLLFTLLSNLAYRQAYRQATARLNDWLSFLQLQLLPQLQSDLSQGLDNLKVVLDSFNQDFFQRVSDFKAVFANLNQYVGLQERFLVSLQESDYTQLTEANLKFFDQIKQNETMFERFGQYLQRLNESMETGREAASDIREIVSHLRQLDDVQGYLRQNEELIRRQLGYLAQHEEKMERLTRGIEQHFIEAGDEIGRLVQRRLQVMQREEQDAGEQLRQHFERLRSENVYQKIADQLQPIHQMEEDVQSMRELFAETLKHLLESQQYLIRKINQDGQTQGRLLKEMELLNGHMQQLNERKSWMQRLLGGR
ncbi:hypothetical protein [Cesiribacter andamanensis]|uniref:MotA/TolQ/ExbB proton channel domain-containing protein n=1 Tax=Cesiribacter andamanensis AMV16 TaxID=1279009 RepID=M7P0I4_9BACT|nr:hypothetical protein [Cesiribacter andamanensis]EMR04109.1 hypothetical protein ADICEAN_00732 [Cesiribacter andamanensis AMV16]